MTSFNLVLETEINDTATWVVTVPLRGRSWRLRLLGESVCGIIVCAEFPCDNCEAIRWSRAGHDCSTTKSEMSVLGIPMFDGNGAYRELRQRTDFTDGSKSWDEFEPMFVEAFGYEGVVLLNELFEAAVDALNAPNQRWTDPWTFRGYSDTFGCSDFENCCKKRL